MPHDNSPDGEAETLTASVLQAPEGVEPGEEPYEALSPVDYRYAEEALKPFVHRMATSYDIVDTANTARFRDAALEVVVPELVRTHHVVLDLTERYADQRQIGRTHGQHAVPITFGFAMAEYADRLGMAIQEVQGRAEDLRGKFSGAVGAYNASSLFLEEPQEFEAAVLAKLGLEPAGHATQIVPPEYQTRFLYAVMESGTVLANLADDMRHLQRSEIAEVGEPFAEGQAGSSTMTQKRNPINLENTSSMGKELTARFVGAMLDMRSEHQRDLTGSASGRTRGEMLAYLTGAAKRMTRTMGKLRVDEANMERNLSMSRGGIMGEPVYLLLAAAGHPDAYNKSKELTLQAEGADEDFFDIVSRDPEVQQYFADLSEEQKEILRDPTKYTGLAADIARERVAHWWNVYAAD